MTRAIRLAPVVVIGLAACSFNTNKIKPTVEDLCREVVSVLGERVAQCEGLAVAWAQWALSADLNCAQWGESVAAGRMGYDESAGVQCISDLQSMSCDQLFASNGPPGACAQAIWGQVPAGYACITNLDCANGTYCEIASSCGGTCRAYANLGQVCYDSSSGSGTQCIQGLNCMPDPTPATTSRCQAPIQAGYACPNGWGCANGLYCDWVTTSLTYHTCQPDRQLNQSCDPYPCDDGLYCNQDSTSPNYKKCVAQQTSGPCGQWNACRYPLYVCSGAPPISWSAPGNCRPIAREGQSCKHGYGDCVWGAYCRTGSASPATGDSGVCTVFSGPSGICGDYGSEWVECIASYCYGSPSGTCAPYIPLGGTCVSGGPWDQCGYDAYCPTAAPYVCTAYCP